MKTLHCDEARARVSDFIAGDASRHEANLLEAHLAGCAPCREVAERFVWQDRVIAEHAGKARLDKVAGRIHAALGTLEQLAPGETDRIARPRRWVGAAVAASALVAAGLAALIFWPSHDPSVVAHEEHGRKARVEPVPKARVEPRVESPRPVPEDPAPESVEPKTEEAPVPEAPRTPPVVANTTPPPQAPKRQDPNLVQPELPKAPAPAARDASKPPAREHVIEITPARTPDAAIDRGVAFLRTRSPKLEFSRLTPEARQEELVLWTYFMAGVPEHDPEFQRLYHGILEHKLERTYDVALQAMFLEELDRVKYQWRLLQCAQFLVDNQCRNGQWSYGAPSLFVEELPSGPLPAAAGAGAGKQVREFPPSSSPFAREKPKVKRFITVVKRREGPDSGDNSNSMYAALGLRACADAGILLPKEVLASAERAWREGMHDEGWCYGPKGHGHKPYASMTAGGVGSLVILDSVQGREWKADPQVKAGLNWIAKNFSVTEHRGPPEHAAASTGWMQYYYMYALERAGILYGAEKLGSHDWYKEGVEALLDAQRLDDGSWASKDGGNPVNDTCFAILFLRRATRGLPPVATK